MDKGGIKVKQHITLEDIKGLDTAIFVSLIKNGYIKHDGLFRTNTFVKKLTIGKMIEILTDYPNKFIISIRPKFRSKNNQSYVELGIKDLMAEEKCIDSWYTKGFHAVELCDALFEAIKYALEE